MLKSLGIVELSSHRGDFSTAARSRSLAGRRLGDKPLLEWVVRRVTESLLLDRVVVVAGSDPLERRLAQLVPPDVALFQSDASDPLQRFAEAVREYAADNVVRVCLDNAFIDPELVDRLITTADSFGRVDYIGYCFSDGRPAMRSKLGVLAEWCRAEAVQRAAREAKDPLDRFLVTRYIYSHPERFDLRLIPVPPPLDRDDVRLAIDVEEDWEHAQVIFDALGPEGLDWQRIAGLLDQHPAIRERMAVLNQTEVPPG